MALSKIIPYKKIVQRLLTDEGLTKKASLNALAAGLDYFAQLVVGFIITPLIVTALGNYFYGVWQILNRLFGYISTSGSSTSALKFTLAKEQSSEDYDSKRAYVGSALIIWALLIPVTCILGGLITWYAPYWLHAPEYYFWEIRAVALIFMGSVICYSISYMPQAILQGQNQGYRRIGLSVAVFFLNGGITWLAIYLETGIIGLAISYLIGVFITGLFYFLVCRSYIPWLGVKWPSFTLVKKLLKLSWWFLAWDAVANLTIASDVVVLGLVGSVASVTSYTLTKYIPETIITLVAIMVVGIMPGLGGIIGVGDLNKAAKLRGEIFSFTWIIITVVGTTTLLWNREFLGLWVGSDQYAGTIPCLLIVIVVTQFVFIRTDGFIIDLTLKLQRKVIFGAISVLVSILIASFLVKFYNLGMVGVSLGLIVGRSILNVAYPLNISHYLGISLLSQIKTIVRPVFITALLYILASIADSHGPAFEFSGVSGWMSLVIGVSISAILILLLAYFIGLNHNQRSNIVFRIRYIVSS